MKKTSTVFFLGIFMALTACNEEHADLEDGLYAEFKTNKGTFIAQLYYQQTPLTVANFVTLAEGTNTMVDTAYKDKKFYNGLIFHRVIADFMIQGGDPEGTGRGGPGYKFEDEFVDSLNFDSKGLLAMANSGPNTNGSQFFITLKPTPHLNQRHTIFGEIVKGQEVVDSIGVVKTGPGDKPMEDVVIQNLNIIRKGNAAKDFNAVKVFTDKMEAAEKEKAEAQAKMDAAKKEAAAMIAEIKPQAEELPSGLKIHFTEKGDGEKPNIGDKVGVYYEGYLPDGTLFDSNKKEVAEKFGKLDPRRAQANGYQPMTADYGPDARMIAGFKEGLMEMSVGDEAVLFIPSHLGYGDRGVPGVIPPGSDLIFVVELVDIK
jgi:peptidylprolyl isomerase